MFGLERLLFFPALLAASVFVVRQLMIAPSQELYAALGALILVWAGVIFRSLFRLVRLFFWLAAVCGLLFWGYVKSQG